MEWWQIGCLIGAGFLALCFFTSLGTPDLPGKGALLLLAVIGALLLVAFSSSLGFYEKKVEESNYFDAYNAACNSESLGKIANRYDREQAESECSAWLDWLTSP